MKKRLVRRGIQFLFWTILVGYCILFLPEQVAGQNSPIEWAATQMLFDASAGWGEHQSLVADSFGQAHLVWEYNASSTSTTSQDYRPEETQFYYSRWDGTAWSAPIDVLYGKLAYPRIAADSLGRLHLVFSDGECVSYVWAWIREANTAQGWSSPQCIGPRSLNHSVTVDHQGVLHALMAQPEQLLYVQSPDGGASWTEPIRVTDAPLNATYTPEIVTDEFGTVHAVWSQAQLPDGIPFLGVFYSRSDDGYVWSQPISLAAGNYRDPAIAVSEKDVYVVWNSGVAESRRFLAHSRDRGMNWEQSVTIVEAMGGWLWHPGISVDSSGTLHIVTAQGVGALYVTLPRHGRASAPLQLFDPEQQTAAPYVVTLRGNQLLAVFRGPGASIFFTTAIASSPEVIPLALPQSQPLSTGTFTLATPKGSSAAVSMKPTASTKAPVALPTTVVISSKAEAMPGHPLLWATLPTVILIAVTAIFALRRRR